MLHDNRRAEGLQPTQRRTLTMTDTYPGRLAVALILALAIGLPSAGGQDKDSGKSARPTDAAKNRRIAYVVQHGVAKDLAAVLSKHFQGAAEVQVLPASASNCLLINAPAAVFDEVIKLLAQFDRRPLTIAVEVLVAEVRAKKGGDGK